MKKKFLFGGLGVVLLAGAFLAGSYVNGAADWKSEVINSANTELGRAGYNKKQELLNDPNAITNGMKNALLPEIEAQQKELERLLEEYYQLKLKGLTSSDQFKDIEKRIAEIRQSIFERYKKEIDQAFSGQ